MNVVTFAETLVQREGLLYRKAILEELISCLSKFIDTDSTKAKLGLTISGTGAIVPQEFVEKHRAALAAEIEKIDIKMKKLHHMKVEDHESTKQSKAKVKAKRPSQTKAKAKSGSRASKSRPNTGKS